MKKLRLYFLSVIMLQVNFGASISFYVGQELITLIARIYYHSNGEGNGTPLQYSCLENPMEGGAGGLQSMGSHRVGHD